MIQTREQLRTLCHTTYGIPTSGAEALESYLFDRIPPGSFFRALMENDFVSVFATADTVNRYLLRNYADLMYNELPTRSYGPGICPYGSAENVEAWLEGYKNEHGGGDEDLRST